MFCVFTEVMAHDDKFLRIKPRQLLPWSKVDQSKLRIHEVPPLQ